jgi:hypothetical protein
MSKFSRGVKSSIIVNILHPKDSFDVGAAVSLPAAIVLLAPGLAGLVALKRKYMG